MLFPELRLQDEPGAAKAIRDILRAIDDELDSEIHSDTSCYTLNLNYEEVLKYEETNDDDEEGL